MSALSSRRLRIPSLRRRQTGQAMVEYIVAALAVMLLLAVMPIPGLGGPAGESVVGWLVGVLHTWWMNFTFLISLP
jgi:hypothetical protein